MRITDHYTPLEVLAEILAYASLTEQQTTAFSEDYLSSHDNLLTEIRYRLDAILNSFKRLGCDTYETQGLDDKGVDILWKIDEAGKSRCIGLQIKSNREADECAETSKAHKKRNPDLAVEKEDTLLKTLKRQAFEARMQAKVDEWWVLPCFNLKKHKKRLAAITTSFQLPENPSWPINVVRPERILGFISMTAGEVDAFCVRLLCQKDEVLTAARTEFGTLSGAAQIIVSDTISDALNGHFQLNEDALFDIIQNMEDGAESVHELEACGYITKTHMDAPPTLNPHIFKGLCALYFEGRVRHHLKPDDAIRFVWRLLDDFNQYQSG